VVSLLLAACLGMNQVAEPAQELNWKVTPERSFEVDGAPYLPVGVHVEPTVEAIDAVAKAGIKDVFVELPLDLTTWRRIIPELESRGLRYLVGISSLAPSASVVAVEPKSYRVSGLSGKIDITVDIPGGSRAYGLLANEKNGGIIWQGTHTIENGKLHFEYDLRSDFPHVLVLYPEVRDQRMADYWEGFDQYRDNLLIILKNAQLGAGYQGLVNPAGKMLTSFQVDDTLVPTSELFRLELETYLRQRYGTAEMVGSSWHMGVNQNQTLADFAACVPLWQGGRGIEYVWNAKMDRIAPSQRRDEIWNDIRTVVRSSATRRLNRLVESIKEATKKPVMQEWNGWGGLYEDGAGSLDGITFGLAPRSAIDLMDSASRPMSSALRRARPMAAMATSITLPTGENRFDAGRAIRQSEMLGTRGWFFNVNSAEELAEVASASETYRDQLSIARNGVLPVFFPEAATNPAVTGRLPGGHVWLPTPGSGERLDIGPTLEGYRYVNGGKTTYVFWSIVEKQRLKMRLASEVLPTMVALDGSDMEIKQKKNEIEMTVPTTPVIVEGSADIPVPIQSFEVTKIACSYLIDTFGNLVDLAGTEYVTLQKSNSSFDRFPLGSFLAIRAQFKQLAIKSAPYNWIEAESPQETNFSDIGEVSGASGGKVLVLNPKVRSLAPYVAQYIVRNKIGSNHSVWIAARMDDVAREALRISVGGVEMRIEPNPVSYYGAGFAWYRCGNLDLPDGQTQLWVRAQADRPIHCEIDTLMVAPGQFRPNGPNPPTDWVWAALDQARPPLKKD
jgi:hypothetical protein